MEVTTTVAQDQSATPPLNLQSQGRGHNPEQFIIFQKRWYRLRTWTEGEEIDAFGRMLTRRPTDRSQFLDLFAKGLIQCATEILRIRVERCLNNSRLLVGRINT
jgi:hypothetical protein